ncbi:MAG: nuclear transport factor 2 family protein [Candidatus Kapabacteria bacterium]|nr:nuclear transport factor 2 family protein [Candidatus Kapabacteria bacterium]
MRFSLQIILILIASFFLACQPKPKFLSPLEIQNEKEKVQKVIVDFHTALEDKNFGKLVETLADEVIFFGTDSSEIIKTFADFKMAIDQQWKDYDHIDYGELRDVSIQMDDNATLASIIYGTNAVITKGGVDVEYYLRIARILRKKDDRWLIVSGIVGIVRTDDEARRDYEQSSSQAPSNQNTQQQNEQKNQMPPVSKE